MNTILKPETADLRASRTLLLTGHSESEKRRELRDYFNHTFTLYESLFETINADDAYYLRAEPLRHPLIFYFGHTATFFINKLILGKYIDRRVNETFESMFAVGVDEMSWDDLNDAHYDWPAVDQVRAYRDQVRNRVDNLIADMPLSLPITQDSLAWVIMMGIEHERIHLETSSVIIRMLPSEKVSPHDLWEPCRIHAGAPDNQLLPVDGQTVVLGKDGNAETYGWDNEYGHLPVTLKPFRTSKYLVSNQEYLEFVEQGGYRSPGYWTPEGQKWLAYSGAQMPRFWLRTEHGYRQRNMLETIPLPMNWPVEVNYLEAKAFCNWKSAHSGRPIRLPTEAEWMALRNTIDTDQPHWDAAPGNVNLEYYASSCPVDQFQTDGFFDIVGNVWQWTETPIDGYPGFEVHELYDDFSTPTFDGRHNIFKGGSWISTGNEAIRHSRYAFRRHFFQHAGFRYVESEHSPDQSGSMNIYETDALVSRYLHFHYGPEYLEVPNYPRACAQAALRHCAPGSRTRALDLGCSVGRATFELGLHFEHVDGIDFSARFIQHGFRLQEAGSVRYTIPTEGELVAYEEAGLANSGLDEAGARVNFIQGDACNLKPLYTNYDLVLCANLLDRLYDPALFLETIPERLKPQGLLVMSSPYTWLEEYTEKSRWLGGIKVNGENYSTLDGLKESLSAQFELLEVVDVPFVIRETQRKFQYGIAQMTVWKKR